MSAHATKLSDLNRAALGGEERYWWIHGAAGAYCLLMCYFSVASWVTEQQYFHAGTCAGAQALAVVTAILARRAFTGQMPWMGTLLLVATGGCAWWASLGLQHAWEISGSSIESGPVFFLAALEPGLFLAAEHIQEGRETLRKHAAASTPLPVTAPPPSAPVPRLPPKRVPLHLVPAAGGVAQSMIPGAALAHDIALPPAPAPQERPAIVSMDTGYPTAKEHAYALKDRHPDWSQERIAKEVGAARPTVGKWLRARVAA